MYSPRASIEFLIFVALILGFGVGGLVAFAPRDSMGQALTPAKPPRIAGDGTSRVMDGIAWLLGFAGVFAGMTWYLRWGRAEGLPVSRGYSSWLQILAAILVTTAIHELGHASVGLAAGMKLRAFIVGPFQWRIRDGRWTFQFLPARFFSAGGATALVPTDPGQSLWLDVCMIAAGPVSNLFSGALALALMLTAQGSSYEQYWEFFGLTATLSLVGFAMNLIPFRPEAAYSDGARIYQLLGGGPWADLHRAFSIVTSTSVTALRPKDYDIDAIQRAELGFTQGHQALLLRLFASSYFIDCGMIRQACDAVAEAERIYQESASDISADLLTVFVFDNAFLRRDAAGTRLWWDRMEAKKPTHFGVDYWLAKSSLSWIEGRKDEAREAWGKGNLLAQKLPAAGDCEFDRYRYKLLHQCIENEETIVAS
jgi:hypothetical protein